MIGVTGQTVKCCSCLLLPRRGLCELEMWCDHWQGKGFWQKNPAEIYTAIVRKIWDWVP
jgi:hypothetical protein